MCLPKKPAPIVIPAVAPASVIPPPAPPPAPSPEAPVSSKQGNPDKAVADKVKRLGTSRFRNDLSIPGGGLGSGINIPIG